MKLLRTAIFLILALSLVTGVFAQNNEDSLIQMAILLDTSNSMDGLIDQAKSHLWKIVNELALSKKNGKTPMLEVALYEYGKSSLPASQNYLRMVAQLTTDLDLISEELFNLTTNGGDEYCGAVINSSINELKWSKRNDILKVIFIAGNEPFDQGGIDYVKSAKRSIKKGIIVNTIYCGDMQEGIDGKWKHGAELADGTFMNINQNLVEEYIPAPQDERIIALNEELNKTYVGYGHEGDKKKEMQRKQDSNAWGLNKESAIQRTITKSNKVYDNSSWDLVDAVTNEELDVAELEEAELPEEMKEMNDKERVAYVKELTEKRAKIQTEIQKLNEERNEYIEKVKKEKAEESSLDDAIIRAIKTQAIKKNYKF